MTTPASPLHIAERIVEAVLAQKLAPGDRLGEQELADNFAVSRTVVREAMVQLQARGFVQVQPRKGWFIVQPSADEARDAFSARRIIEAGILQEAGKPLQKVIGNLRKHIAHEKDAIEEADAATRAFLLADFHVCLAEQMGHKLLADTLRDLTARTTLAATLYQSTHSASQSCAEHEGIVQALEDGDTETAKQLLIEHIGTVERSLEFEPEAPGEAQAADRLRAALAPVGRMGG
ncbi:GntR family transcriptional regulator [Diaphorobacter ruginosibacter]|jgi:DNA-binding GntR family transcriptional regulator|uniref:GntR family transcriptional regulator n=1 Tax=Diaphorobacter ruginosibacter TaxID=1715720 RepID=A0A7G9RP13_9BURK|nr:GntR family transcriptional regulator [Diaphorobacter ruginosibacter]MDR2334394.1 GntR family transcriptional regulator [Burkholderiaceae bacterium]QNN57338.1 GntR family transcriptional regulator [Diaphorobacter ruginosibacter]